MKRGKVLVIEDDLTWQNNLRDFLEIAGFEVIIVTNLSDAIESVENNLFHFITIDMNLDEKFNDADNFEGWDILSSIKKLRSQDITPTMVITGYGDEYKTLKSKKKLSSIFFMEKPAFDREKFINTVVREVERINLTFHNDKRGN